MSPKFLSFPPVTFFFPSFDDLVRTITQIFFSSLPSPALTQTAESLNDERAAISGLLEERLAALWAEDDLPRARILIETLLRVGKAACASEAAKHRRLRRGNATVRNRILWAGHAGHDLLLWLGFELTALGKSRRGLVLIEEVPLFFEFAYFLHLIIPLAITLT